MKKLAITGAAVALAAMPALGAFADVTDTVIITLASSCSVGSTTSSTGTGKTIDEQNAQNGTLYTYAADGSAGGTIKVTCNDAGGWMVKAVGSGDGATVDVMDASASGTDIATGTATSGDTSNWAFKVASSTAGVTIESTYQNFAAVPTTATKVASGSAAISEGTINTGYQVWVSATQQADTYTGKVTYTVHHPNA